MHASPSQDGLFSVPASLYGLTAGQRGFFLHATMLFELQGHRGARALFPENTLPSFECALDLGVSAIETDLHLTRDDVPVLCHDPILTAKLCRLLPGASPVQPSVPMPLRDLRVADLRGYRADRNPDPARFPEQRAGSATAAELFAAERGLDPYTVPTLEDLFAFTAAYAGELGARADKDERQRERAAQLRFDLELKRVPAHPEYLGDDFDGHNPGRLERTVVEAVRRAGVVARTTVRSFDHRAVRAIRQLEPGLTGAVLLAETAPVDPSVLVRQADAHVYAPEHRFLDRVQVEQCHAAGIRVLPWTVNEEVDWERLLAMGVDGMTTDTPDRLSYFLVCRRISY